ncbi:uncharacterized protein LOC122138122 isoform X2 [Cyprinus carpio]|uniref:Uncharacterized protein LOC122138122 isoform X2 n=1 Tax=Cyprinus carpio TaxID=7962 RepID=A0A9Q9WK52_CYPCA|nr:uncharacterized protein LOC122138122 isoform X2 [Cyprinus carpio]
MWPEDHCSHCNTSRIIDLQSKVIIAIDVAKGMEYLCTIRPNQSFTETSTEPVLDGPRGVYPVYTLHGESGHVQLCSLPVGAAHRGDSIHTSQTRHSTVIPNTAP